MKKLLAIFILLAAGTFVMAQDTAQTEETPDEDVEYALQNFGKLPSGELEKIKDDEKQLTASQKARIIRRELSKRKKLLKKRQKHEMLIEINQRHLDYKKRQLEQFTGEKADENSNNEEIKKEDSKEVTENKTEAVEDKKDVKNNKNVKDDKTDEQKNTKKVKENSKEK